MGYRLKPRCKHHAVIDGILVKYGPSDILESVSPKFLNKFDKVDDPVISNPLKIKPGTEEHGEPLIPVKMTESAKKFIEDNSLDPTKIEPTGKDDTITKKDAVSYYEDLEEE
jgi:hypothetical protein